MNDATLVKLAAIGALTVLAVAYFIFAKQDGAIFGTVTTTIGVIVGFEVGKSKSP